MSTRIAKRPGEIIFLNGPSGAGKTSLGAELVDLLYPPHFHLSVDVVNAMRSKKKTAALPEEELEGVLRATRAGFHRAVAGMALAGNNVVMDYVLSESWRLRDCLQVFDGLRVIFVGVRCHQAELERRERARSDRVNGTAASQSDTVHSYGPYDIEVWTDELSPRDAASYIVTLLPSIGLVTSFDRLRLR